MAWVELLTAVERLWKARVMVDEAARPRAGWRGRRRHDFDFWDGELVNTEPKALRLIVLRHCWLGCGQCSVSGGRASHR